MPTADDILSAFTVHLEEMERCAAAKCNWALLHLIVTTPDICAAAESPTGVTSERLYQDLCKSRLDCTVLNELERYKMRCGLLHVGQAHPDASRLKAGQTLRYDGFEFGPSGTPHMQVTGRQLSIDVGRFHQETVVGFKAWAADPATSQNPNLPKNLPRVAAATAIEKAIPMPIPIISTPMRMFMPGAMESDYPSFQYVTVNITK